METISLKMDKNLLNNIDKTLKNHNYSTRTEFIRDSIRSKLTQLEKEEAIRKLAELKGKFKSKSNKSDEKIRQEAIKRFFIKKGWDLNELD